MRSLSTMIVAAFLIAAVPVAAQVDPDPDGLGIYADQGGLTNSLEAQPGFIDVYLLATHTTTPRIKGWGARVEITGNALVTDLNTPYPSDLIYTHPDPASFEYIVTANPDLPLDEGELLPAPIIHLATLRLYIFDTAPVELYVMPFAAVFPGSIPQTWYYVDEGTYHSSVATEFHPSTGSWEIPVMSINGPAAIPVVPCTWSEVRALYR